MKENYFDEVISFENLYKALKAACKNVRWKDSVVGYEYNGFANTHKLIEELENDEYELQKYQKFIVYEPKKREIAATRIRDRQFQAALSYAGLYEDITEHFIRDNCACQKNRGTDDAIKRLKTHMHRFYRKHQLDGWVLKCDIRKFFPSINHDVAKRCINKYVTDARVRKEVFKIIDSFDVGIGLGSEISQLMALCILNEMDHFIKERLHIKYYVRYMDDFVLIHEDKEYLKYCQNEISKLLADIYLELNEKTTLHPLKQGIKFLQWRFILTDTGKLLLFMDRKKISKQKQRIRKLLAKEFRGEIPKGTAEVSLKAWMANAARGNTYKIQMDMVKYFEQKEEEYARKLSCQEDESVCCV